MDPANIGEAAASLVFTIVKAGKALATVFSEQETTPRWILLFQTEFVVLTAALSQIQLVFQSPTIRRYPEALVWAIELTLVGCDVTLSLSSRRIAGLGPLPSGKDMALDTREQTGHVRNEDTMMPLLQLLQAESSAIALLLKALDSWSLERISVLVEAGQPFFTKIEEGISSIRASNPHQRFAETWRDISSHESKAVYSLMEPALPSTINAPSQRTFLRGPRFRQSALPSPSSIGVAQGCSALDEDEITQTEPRPHARRRGLRIGERMAQTAASGPSLLSPEGLFIRSLSDLQRKLMAPALALGIVSKVGSSIYIQGIRKYGSAVPASRDDRFGVAGISYMMITTVLAIMMEKGLLKWSTTIQEALPEMVDAMHPAHYATTLEMLCAHASGIETSVWEISEGEVWDQLKSISGRDGRTAVARAVLAIPPATSPGTATSWNENSILIVALILEERCSEPIETLLKRELFDPLQMYNTSADAPHAPSEEKSIESPTAPWPHSISPDGESPVPREPTTQATHIPAAYQPLDNIHSSMPDLVRFFELHLRGFSKHSTALMDSFSFQKLHTPFLGTDRTPGGWCGTGSDLRVAESFHGWGISVAISSSREEAYICLANIGSAFPDFVPEEFDEILELCARRSQDITFHHTIT